MISGKKIFRHLFDRRGDQKPVSVERRVSRPRPCEAEKMLNNSIERLSNALKGKNSVQRVGQFSTFAEVCNQRVPWITERICRHQQNKGHPCNEGLCPFTTAKAIA